jgi:hypothetical protein
MEKKYKLRIVDPEQSVIEGTTCFHEHAKYDIQCMRNSCPHWVEYPSEQNCVINASRSGPHTLQEIGQIFNLTRMRICQIEKRVLEKIRKIS